LYTIVTIIYLLTVNFYSHLTFI